MTRGIREEVDRLLKKAHYLMMEVEHITATEEEKRHAKEQCKKLYNQIQMLDEYTYRLVSATIAEEEEEDLSEE